MQQFRFPDAAPEQSDRQPIRLDYPCRQEGIAAALRRAFAAAADQAGEEDFDALLKELN